MRSLLPLIIIVALFALLFMGPMRRQKRLAAEARSLRNQLEPGDEVVTTSGIYGTISEMTDEFVTLEIAPGVPVRFAKAAIGQKVAADDGYASDGGYAEAGHEEHDGGAESPDYSDTSADTSADSDYEEPAADVIEEAGYGDPTAPGAATPAGSRPGRTIRGARRGGERNTGPR